MMRSRAVSSPRDIEVIAKTRIGWVASGSVGYFALLCAACVVLLSTLPAHAQQFPVDKATVRVSCLNGFDVQAGKLAGADVTIAVPQLSRGSGFVAGKKGVIVTARHVVEGAKFVMVSVPGAPRPLPAKVVHGDEKLDVAFLRLLETVPSRADWKNPKELHAGDSVVAVGYPVKTNGSEVQSSKTVVTSTLPDGRLQLDLSADEGYFGAPVVDDRGRIHAIVTRADGAKVVATPLKAFKPALTHEVYDKRQGQLASLGDEATLRMVDLLLAEQDESTSLVRRATELEGEAGRAAEETLRGLSQLAAKSPHVAMVMAAFFWNQHVALAATRRSADSPRANAKTLVSAALVLDSSYKSPFTELALSDRAAVEAVEEEKPAQVRKTTPTTVRFVASAGVSLLGKKGRLQAMTGQPGPAREGAFQRVCSGSCDLSFEPGEFELALSNDDGDAIPLEKPVKIDGSSDLHATYVDKGGTRTVGLMVLVAGVVGGTLVGGISLFPNCDGKGEKCERNNLGLIAGAAGIGVGVGVGLPMMLADDEVGVKLVPRGTGASARSGPGASVEYSGRF